MAQDTEQTQPAPAPPQETPAQQASNAFAQSQAEAARLNLTETVEGGSFIVGGQTVDAFGNPVKDSKGK